MFVQTLDVIVSDKEHNTAHAMTFVFVFVRTRVSTHAPQSKKKKLKKLQHSRTQCCRTADKLNYNVVTPNPLPSQWRWLLFETKQLYSTVLVVVVARTLGRDILAKNHMQGAKDTLDNSSRQTWPGRPGRVSEYIKVISLSLSLLLYSISIYKAYNTHTRDVTVAWCVIFALRAAVR